MSVTVSKMFNETLNEKWTSRYVVSDWFQVMQSNVVPGLKVLHSEVTWVTVETVGCFLSPGTGWQFTPRPINHRQITPPSGPKSYSRPYTGNTFLFVTFTSPLSLLRIKCPEAFSALTELFSSQEYINMYLCIYIYKVGQAVAQLVEALSHKQGVAGSIPDGVFRIFYWHNPSGHKVGWGRLSL